MFDSGSAARCENNKNEASGVRFITLWIFSEVEQLFFDLLPLLKVVSEDYPGQVHNPQGNVGKGGS